MARGTTARGKPHSPVARSESIKPAFKSVLRDWRCTYAFVDLVEATGRCELCNHQHIRYKFEIENLKTKEHLWVGSECIRKFIPMFDSRGIEIRGERRKEAVLEKITTDFRTKARQQRAFKILNDLAAVDNRFDEPTWRENWKQGYSARQLQLLAVCCKVNAIPFNSSDFRINTRKGWVRERIRELQDWQYRQLRGALTGDRIREFDPFFGL